MNNKQNNIHVIRSYTNITSEKVKEFTMFDTHI